MQGVFNRIRSRVQGHPSSDSVPKLIASSINLGRDHLGLDCIMARNDPARIMNFSNIDLL